MAGRRGRNKSLAEQIQIAEQKIKDCKGKLMELEANRTELLKQQEEQELKALRQCMAEKGLRVEDVYELIEQAGSDQGLKAAVMEEIA